MDPNVLCLQNRADKLNHSLTHMTYFDVVIPIELQSCYIRYELGMISKL